MMNKGISPFLATSLIILFSIMTVGIVTTTVKPVLDRTKDTATTNEGFQNLELIDDTILEVASEEKGSRRTISIKMSDGDLYFDPWLEYLNYTYKLNSNLAISGQRGRVNTTISSDILTLFIKYDRIDLLKNIHFPKGSNQVIITNEGINSTVNKPMINITS